jgi:hypothetical protein
VGRVDGRIGVKKSMLMMLMIVFALRESQGLRECYAEISGNSILIASNREIPILEESEDQ